MGSPETEELPGDETRNFALLALYQVIQRIGWIFKTESIVMPAFMDFIGGGPVLRGMLPVLNRLGFAIPPVLFARRLKLARHKKLALAMCSLGKCLPFAILSGLWFTGTWKNSEGDAYVWMPWLYLILYAAFFALVGVNQLADHTLQGKLIKPWLRGRLLMASVVVGGPLAILAAMILMPSWLAMSDGGYGWIFGMPALLFCLSAVVATLLHEPPDEFQQPRAHPWHHVQEATQVLLYDHSFRRLAMVAAAFSAGFMMFPHYQALAREKLGLGPTNLVWWVCVQNAATTLASVVTGPLADRFGNRLALNVAVLGSAAAPILATVFAFLPASLGYQFFWIVFLPIGLTPITMKLMANFTLEIVDREHHPRYVSTLGACLAVPVVVGAPLVGWLVELVGYRNVFLAGGIVMVLAGILTFRLPEPRHALTASAVLDTPRWTE